MNYKKAFFPSFLTLACTLASAPLVAEVQPGTILSSSNIDQLYDDTFEGHKIKDLLTEKVEWRIRENGFEMKLVPSQSVTLGKEWVARSQQNVGKVSINEEKGRIDGWVGGAPFPNIDMSDPEAAKKVIWNWYYGNPRGDVMNVPNVAYVLIDGDSGIERVQNWKFVRYTMKGRMNGEQVEGDGSELSRTIFVATGPRDIKGLGTYTVRKDNEEVEDVWAYIRAVRRTRRLSGGAWMDPVGGTDQLQDDIEVFNANPTWYKEYRMLGKRHILTAAHGVNSAWNPDGGNDAESFPTLDLSKAPYWNFNQDRYEPREVYVIEAIPPEEHPYSKKVLYIDTEYPRIHMGEAYDKKGDFWKMFQFHSYPNVAEDGSVDVRTTSGATIDFKRNHATVFFPDTNTWSTNTPGLEADDVSLSVLRATAR
ncbi:DUF1329 domain-containing protein [Marinobacterium stanieri]|uniref:DUF1329 domain-containing protein n=1 Tax=Marinobacterium stanieri TaxID=49186 RepID=UPI000255A665|nr:DUF1329 domain-containing protein [Marinobacterium stanieri]